MLRQYTTTLIQHIKSVPLPIRCVTYSYITVALGMHFSSTYNDCKMEVLKYDRSDKDDEIRLKTRYEIAKQGANKNWWDNMGNSIIWPCTFINSVVPWIVLSLNPETKKNT